MHVYGVEMVPAKTKITEQHIHKTRREGVTENTLAAIKN